MTEPTQKQQEVMNLLENLIRVARRNDITIAGFAFATQEPFMFVNFGNCPDLHDIKLYQNLIDFRDKLLARGQKVTETTVNEVN